MTPDDSVHDTIRRLVDEEHALRVGHPGRAGNSARLQEVRLELDRCWDLLRQRRALRTAGADPDTASLRPANQVDRYLQ